jgi:hypothetical protein
MGEPGVAELVMHPLAELKFEGSYSMLTRIFQKLARVRNSKL